MGRAKCIFFKKQAKFPQSYGGRVSFERSDKAGGTSRIKTADGEELRNEWDYRLTKWFRNKDSMFT